MKKMTMMCMAALLLMAVSCKKEKAGTTYFGEGFRATTESHTGEGDSKTQLNSDLSVTWCDGDVIKVFSTSDQNGKKFSAASAGTAADFNPKEDVTDAFFTPPYTAFYPESAVGEANQIRLNGTQHYTTFDDGNGNNVLTFASGENPMAAQSTSKVLSFKNLCGILKFQLYSENPCTVKTLCVTSLKTGEQLWGTGVVSFDGTDATLGTLTNGGGSIILDCGEEGVNLSLSEETPTEFMVVIPAGALSEGFTVKVTDMNGTYWIKAAYASANNTIVRSKIKPMPKQKVACTHPEGTLPGLFSVESGKQVRFSQGNLQYKATGSSATVDLGSNVGGTWRFAEHQCDFIGADNANVAQTYDGWIDLFGWGTSGYNHGGTCYQPWSTSTTWSHYYVYTTSHTSYTYNLENGSAPHTGMADWGKANAISNGGNTAGSWRTLTENEWVYLINTRKDGSGKNLFGEGKVGSTTGLIILPDDWNLPEDLTFIPGWSAWSNVYSYSNWAKMEAAGAVFLPAAGYRYNGVGNLGSYGYYWSSSYRNENSAHTLYFYSGYVSPAADGHNRTFGCSVRLVSDETGN